MKTLYNILTIASGILLAYSVIAMIAGCALVPNTISPELEHMSHVTQHQPFTDTPTRYGINIASVVVGYRLGDHLQLELADGVYNKLSRDGKL